MDDKPSYLTFQFAFSWKLPSLGFYISLDMMNLNDIITGLLVDFLTNFKATYAFIYSSTILIILIAIFSLDDAFDDGIQGLAAANQKLVEAQDTLANAKKAADAKLDSYQQDVEKAKAKLDSISK